MPLKTHLDDEPTLNLTAMLDVMFLLIIFFMLGTRFVDDERKIGLRVPEVVDRGALTAAPARKEVNVFRDGTITLDKTAVTLDQLTTRLAAARRQYSELGVLVRGDARGEFQNVASVLTACKRAGIQDLGITVRSVTLKKSDASRHRDQAMSILRLDRLLEFLTSIELLMAMLWLGLAIFTVGLAILMYTRWGQYKPLRKCMAMSLLAHLLLAGYAATVQIITPIVLPTEPMIHVSLGDGPDEQAAPGGSAPLLSKVKDQPWEVFPGEAVAQPKGAELERGKADRPAEPQRLVRAEDAKLPGDPAVDHVALAEAKLLSPKTGGRRGGEAIHAGRIGRGHRSPAAQRRDAARRRARRRGLPNAWPTTRRPSRPAHVQRRPGRAARADCAAAQNDRNRRRRAAGATADPANPMRLKPVERVAGKVGADAAYGNASPVTGSPGEPARRTWRTRQCGDGRIERAETRTAGGRRNRGNDGQQPVPDAYRLRVAPDRAGVAQSHGGTAETEAAVKAALDGLPTIRPPTAAGTRAPMTPAKRPTCWAETVRAPAAAPTPP